MSNILKSLATLAVTAATVMGTPAFAATQTLDAVGYTFSFDDGLWGIPDGASFSQAGNVFTFSNLGYATSSSVLRRGDGASSFYDWLDSAVTVTAKSGYTLSSIVTGSTGSVSAVAGSNVMALASAFAFSGTYWSNGLGGGYMPSGASNVEAYASAGTPDARTYSVTDTALFNSGETSAVGSYAVSIATKTFSGGSAASVSHDTASFAVAVTAVPEPETYAMLLAGLGLMGAVARRRRAKAA